MHSHGGNSEKKWQGQGLRTPKQVEWVRQEEEPSNSSSRHKSWKIGGFQSVLNLTQTQDFGK